MELNDLRNKNKIAIVVVGYNRLSSLKRLIGSLLNAHYPNNDIPLYISIDASGDTDIYNYVKELQWPNGDKYINIQSIRLGLRKHILQCGDLTKYFRAIVMLEDDLYVSEYFYFYVKDSIAFYGADSRIGGISLYPKEMGPNCLPRVYMEDGSDTFLMQSPASWGQCWNEKYWNLFRSWYDDFKDCDFERIDMPEKAKKWKNAWTKYYQAYLVSTNRYFVYPYKSLTTCFGDAGTHASSSSTYGQYSILTGPKEYTFRPFEDMVRYDIFDVNEDIYNWVGLPKKDVYVDFYGYNQNTRKCRYILTSAKLPYKVIKQYGLCMRPVELNIKYNIEGEGIYLYDTGAERKTHFDKFKLPNCVTQYYMRGFNIRMLFVFSISQALSIAKERILFK